MKPPTVEDFEIDLEDIERANHAKSLLFFGALIYGVAGIAGCMFGKKFDGNHRDLFLWLTVLAMPPHGPLIVYFALKAVLRSLWPKFNRAIRYASAHKAYENWWARTRAQFWHSLSGIQFEHELAALYRRAGIKAEVTSASDDKGVDIWLEQKGRRIPVQCKAHKKPIGPAAARELFGTMKHFGAEEGILASLSGFTRGVRDYVHGKPIKLLAMREIVEMQKQVR